MSPREKGSTRRPWRSGDALEAATDDQRVTAGPHARGLERVPEGVDLALLDFARHAHERRPRVLPELLEDLGVAGPGYRDPAMTVAWLAERRGLFLVAVFRWLTGSSRDQLALADFALQRIAGALGSQPMRRRNGEDAAPAAPSSARTVDQGAPLAPPGPASSTAGIRAQIVRERSQPPVAGPAGPSLLVPKGPRASGETRPEAAPALECEAAFIRNRCPALREARDRWLTGSLVYSLVAGSLAGLALPYGAEGAAAVAVGLAAVLGAWWPLRGRARELARLRVLEGRP